MLDDSLAALRYGKSFIRPRQAGQDGQPRGVPGGPAERPETVRLRIPNGFTVGVPLTSPRPICPDLKWLVTKLQPSDRPTSATRSALLNDMLFTGQFYLLIMLVNEESFFGVAPRFHPGARP